MRAASFSLNTKLHELTQSFVLTVFKDSLTNKFSDTVHLFEYRVNSCRSVKSIALHGRFFSACTGTATASFFCNFLHNSPKLSTKILIIRLGTPIPKN